MTLPNGIDLDQYKTQAKELLKQARAAQPAALDRLRQHHPEHESLARSESIRLADAQLVIARENGFPSWAKFKDYLVFRNAVHALDAGDLARLEALLDQHPALVRYHCRRGEWYEAGYFAGATLLHHIAGNPIRCPLPPNILDIARLLLSRGFEPKAAQETIGLLLTSKQASEAGVALPLIDLLVAAGATFDLNEPDVLSLPLLNVAPATAEGLIGRGVTMDVRHAAALGRRETLTKLLTAHIDPALLEEALAFACNRGQEEAVSLLVRHGAKGDVLVTPGGQTPRTALHEAANGGFGDIVRILLDNGANVSVVEPRWGGTSVEWAEHGGHPEVAALLRQHGSA